MFLLHLPSIKQNCRLLPTHTGDAVITFSNRVQTTSPMIMTWSCYAHKDWLSEATWMFCPRPKPCHVPTRITKSLNRQILSGPFALKFDWLISSTACQTWRRFSFVSRSLQTERNISIRRPPTLNICILIQILLEFVIISTIHYLKSPVTWLFVQWLILVNNKKRCPPGTLWGTHLCPVDSLHTGRVMRKAFQSLDVITRLSMFDCDTTFQDRNKQKMPC